MKHAKPSSRKPAARRMWGGRFQAPPDDLLSSLNDSFAFDRELLAEDIEGSVAWAGALRDCGALTATESAKIVRGLRAIGTESAAGLAESGWEDVHTFVEAALAAKVGPLAGKLHTGRSRNDQVATDLRLYLLRALREGRAGALAAAEALTRRAAKEAATAMPGYTHLRQAEPVTFGHWCLAYVEMLLRDVRRQDELIDRGGECPLGSGALSGTPLPIDRDKLALSLGFARATANSLDAVSDRDLAAEYLFSGTLLLGHLSRLAEDLILYSSDELRFVALPDALATGSSRMPHKKNPDLLELTRGHAARAIGDLAGLLCLMKGLPMAYNKDLQLDKEPVFRMRKTLGLVLPAIAALAAGLTLDRDRMRQAASSDALIATELADALAERGVPFREAHEIVGGRIASAERSGRRLSELGAGGGIEKQDLASLDLDRALARRAAIGGTAPARVRSAAREAARRIAALRREAS
jgi:argininosuccinate lyase